MSFVAILELSIGMVFAWLLVSITAMFIQEWIVGMLSWRSSMLESTIRTMLSDQKTMQQFYAHPLIRSLHSGKNQNKKPSYIPAAQFSLALMDIIKNSAKESFLISQTLHDILKDLKSQKMAKKSEIIARLHEAADLANKAVPMDGPNSLSLMEEVKGILRVVAAEYPQAKAIIEQHFSTFAERKKQIDLAATTSKPNMGNFAALNQGLQGLQLSNASLGQALQALVMEVNETSQNGENQLSLARKNIEAWFNSSMDRLGGWYKRRAQTAAFLIGLSLALILNIDSFQLANQLWRDPSVRQIIATQADSLVASNPDGAGTIDPNQMLNLTVQLNSLNMPVGWLGTPLVTDASGAVAIGDGMQKRCSIQPASSSDVWGVRISNECYPIINSPSLRDAAGWIFKLLGILATAAATAQGAPFWFDILKNLVNIRSAGTNTDAKTARSNN